MPIPKHAAVLPRIKLLNVTTDKYFVSVVFLKVCQIVLLVCFYDVALCYTGNAVETLSRLC